MVRPATFGQVMARSYSRKQSHVFRTIKDDVTGNVGMRHVTDPIQLQEVRNLEDLQTRVRVLLRHCVLLWLHYQYCKA